MKGKQKGITLIALVITIIVLLILAGVSIATLTGQNGILNQAQIAKEETQIAKEKENLKLAANGAMLKDDNRIITEENLKDELNIYIGEKNYTLNIISNTIFLVTYLETNRSYEITSNGSVSESEIKVPEEQPEIAENTFSRGYGVIEIEFLSGTSYNTTEKANTPKMKEDMKAVYWEDDGTEVVEGESDEFDKSKWYDYIRQTGGTEEGGTSKWANAKTSDGSYWVWIPRYAYRIVYFDTEEHRDAYKLDNNKTEGIIGYSDARGIVNTEGKSSPDISTNKTGISVNDKKLRVHPAFENDVEQGGWDSRLEGIWVAKYEMSMEENGIPVETSSENGNTLINQDICLVSKPNVKSWRYINIGNMYTNSYNYDRAKESHLIKNSEWGAVAYLTESNYGRNGTALEYSHFLTGDGGDLSTSTGNIYGVNDLRGGCEEGVAVFNSGASEELLDKGSSFASANGNSTKYATAYQNTRSTDDDFEEQKLSVIGDAIQEVADQRNRGWHWENLRKCFI